MPFIYCKLLAQKLATTIRRRCLRDTRGGVSKSTGAVIRPCLHVYESTGPLDHHLLVVQA